MTSVAQSRVSWFVFLAKYAELTASLAPTAAGTMLVTSDGGAPKPELVTSAVSFLGFSGDSEPGIECQGMLRQLWQLQFRRWTRRLVVFGPVRKTSLSTSSGLRTVAGAGKGGAIGGK